MTTNVDWGDGSGDKIYLTYSASEGDQSVSVTSDANTGAARSKVVTFSTGNITRSLTVNQEAGSHTEYTVRLIPSAYSRSNTRYVTVADPENMYANTDNSSSYATLSHTRGSVTTYDVYIQGFNISSIPANADVSSFIVKIKGYETGINTNVSYTAPSLVNNTTVLSGTTASTTFSGSIKTITFPIGNLTWSNIVSYGSNFGIRVRIRRQSANKQGYVYIYGAEIEVTYTI